MAENKINFCVIGYGRIGKRHANIITSNPECNLIAICDIKFIKDASLQQNVEIYSDIHKMLSENKEIEIVSICTPNYLHESHAIISITHGKHIILEKPMALSKLECENIIHKSLNKGTYVFCVMQNRYSPPSKWIKGIIDQNVLGKIFQIQMNCFWNRDERYYLPNGIPHEWHGKAQMDGGILYTQFSHFIDFIYWVFGDLNISYVASKNQNHTRLTEFDDSIIVQFETNDGALGSMQFSTAVYDSNLESSVTIIGEKGSIKLGGQYMDKILYQNIQNYQMPQLELTNPPNDYGFFKGSAANHNFVIQNAIDVIKKRTQPTTNALEGLKVVEIIEKIYAKA